MKENSKRVDSTMKDFVDAQELKKTVQVRIIEKYRPFN